MSQLPSHMFSRVLSCLMFVAVGLFFVWRGMAVGLYAQIFLGLSMALLGSFSYFQPPLFNVPLRQLFAAAQSAAIGPARLRTMLSIVAISMFVVSLICGALQV